MQTHVSNIFVSM